MIKNNLVVYLPACADNLRFVFRRLFFFDLSHPVQCPCIIHGIIGIDELVAYAVISFSYKLLLAIGSQDKQQAWATLDPLRISGIHNLHSAFDSSLYLIGFKKNFCCNLNRTLIGCFLVN